VAQLGTLAGNRSVARLVAGATTEPEPPDPQRRPLSPRQVTRAIAYTKRRFGIRSQMAIQQLAGVHVDGDVGPDTVQGVARFQEDTRTEPVDGMVGEITLDAALDAQPMVADSGDGAQEGVRGAHRRAFRSAAFIHLVAELFDLPIAREALSAKLVERLEGHHATRFEAGNVRVIELGLDAFASTSTLREALVAPLAAPAPEVAEPGERPTFLTPAEEQDAIGYDRDRLGEGLPTRIVQGVVGATPDGAWGPDTVERVARLQASNGLDDVDGKVGLATLDAIRAVLFERENFDAIVRLVAEFFHLEAAGLLDMGADAELPMSGAGGIGGAITLAPQGVRSPSIVRIRPASLASLAVAATTIAHELAHVRQNFAGDTRPNPVLEFEAHSEEILAPSFRDPRVVPPALVFSKASLIVRRLFWDMVPDARNASWPRFQALRTVARSRFDALPETEREPFADTMEALDAVTDPLVRPEPLTVD
jgi:peptidoglycan hydrolase-like protein with peptidoglycan-binding domain